MSPWLARLLALLVGFTSLLTSMPRVRAQRRVTSIYVLDFNNRTTVGGALLGRVAAAQMSLQLAESLNWDVIPEAQVQRRIQELKLRPPFDRIDRAQIAQGVDASAVVYGNIMEARVSARPAQAYIRLQVVVEDINTGMLVNGAIAEGVSTPRMGFTGDADILLEEALGKAAFRSREFMDRFRLPQGTVLNTSVTNTSSAKVRTTALLNIGARQGVKRGMTFIITRLGEFVGRVRIVNIDADVSTAKVIENFQGVRPEDRARAIFSFEDFPITRGRVRASSSFSRQDGRYANFGELTRVAKAVEAQGAFLPMVAADDAPGLMMAQAPGVPPPVVIDEPRTARRGAGGGGKSILNSSALRMLAGGLLLVGILAIGSSGVGDTRPHNVEAKGFQRGVGTAGARILVTWDRPKRVPSNQVLGHIVWRTDQFGSFIPVWGTDSDAIRRFEDPDSIHDATFWDGDPGDDAGSRTTETDIPGVVAGQQYRYQVSTAFNSQADLDGDGAPDDEDLMSPLSTSSPWATAITPATIIIPINNAQVDLTQLTLSWQQTPGADKYIVLISTVSNFPKGKGRSVKVGTFREVPVDLGGDPIITHTISVSSSKLRKARRVFISVGALNTADRATPFPRGAIYSPPVQVRVLGPPPPPPGTGPASAGEGGPEVQQGIFKPSSSQGVQSGTATVVGRGKGKGKRRNKRR